MLGINVTILERILLFLILNKGIKPARKINLDSSFLNVVFCCIARHKKTPKNNKNHEKKTLTWV